jgi:maltose alpha-D-glucosyltransferase/alpha-amylase
MVRSFQYAGHEALFRRLGGGVIGPEKRGALEAWIAYWETWVSVAYLRAYVASATEGGVALGPADEQRELLTAYLLDKAVAELGAELVRRPEWARVPIRGLLQIMQQRP